MTTKKYLKLFFEEKNLPFVSWSIKDKKGVIHTISNEVVIDFIHLANNTEQKQIADTLRQIDFKNGDVNHFLKFLATVIINEHGASAS